MIARCMTLEDTDGEPVGGKAAGLARLRRMGLRVPESVIVVGARPGALPADLDQRVASLGAVPLAVRSSALGEDGRDASFAGQYETILDVRGAAAVRQAVETCLASAHSRRAEAYRAAREGDEHGEVEADVMAVVVQRMVDARASGVCFTADPVTNRRQRLVLDSIAGLGEALVGGSATPDHDELRRHCDEWSPRELAASDPVLSPADRERIARDALAAEASAGEPLDLEWAIDRDGTLFWLQARPITTLALDPQSLDTPPLHRGDVYTRCNIGEMMPGAVSPLTFSTCARGIDVGWQDNMIALGLREKRAKDNVYVAMSHGHLFLNLSEGARFAVAVTGSHPDDQSLAICGRIVPEVTVPEAPPLRVRLPRLVRQVVSVLRARSHLSRMEEIVDRGAIGAGGDAAATWRNIDARMEDLYEAYARHLTVSSGAGALAPILLRILTGSNEPSQEGHAAVAQLLSGAEGVESADIAQGVARLLEAILRQREDASAFSERGVETAVAWLESAAAGAAGRRYRDYMARHGHRSWRELDVRQPEWAHDPTPLVKSLQAQVRGRLRGGADEARPSAANPSPPVTRRLRWVVPIAHAAVRNRERGKSLLVATTVSFKRAYRVLAGQLVAEGRLPDSDALFFLQHEELGELVAAPPGSALAELAVARRGLLAYQETLSFPEVTVGFPQPQPFRPVALDGHQVVGRPVGCGRAEGRVRVVLRLQDAEALEPGEVLVAPITDVGWTPYFAIIAALVTDVGSAVSHGAVVAREFGLPAVLNTGHGTRVLRTGDLVRVDGDRGVVDILSSASLP